MAQDLSRTTRLSKAPAETGATSGTPRDKDPNVFYPLGRGHVAVEQIEVAKAFCRTCPAKEPCLAYALAAGQQLGIWGGA